MAVSFRKGDSVVNSQRYLGGDTFGIYNAEGRVIEVISKTHCLVEFDTQPGKQYEIYTADLEPKTSK
jgi:hypothetical protein